MDEFMTEIDDTPQDGFEPQPEPPRRRMTAPNGVPILMLDGETPTVAPNQLITLVDSRFDAHMRKRDRKLWGGLVTAAGLAMGSLLAAGKGVLDERERLGAERVQIRTIERDLERLRFELDSIRASDAYRSSRWRRGDQPDPPISAASKTVKGTDQ